MKKNLIKMMLVAVVVIASGVNIYNSQKKSGISDVVLANVEALAFPEEVLNNRKLRLILIYHWNCWVVVVQGLLMKDCVLMEVLCLILRVLLQRLIV